MESRFCDNPKCKMHDVIVDSSAVMPMRIPIESETARGYREIKRYGALTWLGRPVMLCDTCCEVLRMVVPPYGA